MHKGFSRRQKSMVERDFKSRINGTGGTYIGINWKKQTLSFLTPSGKRETKTISFQYERPV